MLKINILNTQDSIEYLSTNKGGVKKNEFFISIIMDTDELLITSKQNILSVEINKNDYFTVHLTALVVKFIQQIKNIVDANSKTNYVLNIHYTDLTHSSVRAIADFTYSIFEETCDTSSYIEENLFDISDEYNILIHKLCTIRDVLKYFKT